MNPLTPHAQIHSICLVIYQEIMHIFTTLPLFREEPEEKHFNWTMVFGLPWEHSHHWVSPFSEGSCLLCISVAFKLYSFDTPSNSPYLKTAFFNSMFLLDIEPSLTPTTCQYQAPTLETADYRDVAFTKRQSFLIQELTKHSRRRRACVDWAPTMHGCARNAMETHS